MRERIVFFFGIVLVSAFIFSAWAQKKKDADVDLIALQKEIAMINTYYQKLSNLVWTSTGGRERMKSMPEGGDLIRANEFFDLLGKREENVINPCAWLLFSKTGAKKEVLKGQTESCKTFLANLRLLQPYLRRSAEVEKCGGPVNRPKEKCTYEGSYSDAIAYEFNVKTAECWLTCGALSRYIDEKLLRYEAEVQTVEGGFQEEALQKAEAERKAEVERQRLAALKADQERRAKLRASKECAWAVKAGILCESRALSEQAKVRLEEEKQAGKQSGYVDKELLQNLETAVQVTASALQRHQDAYKAEVGADFVMSECDGWVRGTNPTHPLKAKLDLQCGY